MNEHTFLTHLIRRTSKASYMQQFVMPDCPFSKLLLAHIKQGRGVMLLEKEEPTVRLFVSRKGNPFSGKMSHIYKLATSFLLIIIIPLTCIDATLCHAWTSIMRDAPLFGLKYFSPSSGRTIFFQHYCDVHGVTELDDLDSVASVMGNSSRTLLSNYAPLRRKKLAQRLVNERAYFATLKFQSNVTSPTSAEGARHQSESGPSGLHGPPPSCEHVQDVEEGELVDDHLMMNDDEQDLVD